jgi:hypothetical protein
MSKDSKDSKDNVVEECPNIYSRHAEYIAKENLKIMYKTCEYFEAKHSLKCNRDEVIKYVDTNLIKVKQQNSKSTAAKTENTAVCKATTKTHKPCTTKVKPGEEYCYRHLTGTPQKPIPNLNAMMKKQTSKVAEVKKKNGKDSKENKEEEKDNDEDNNNVSNVSNVSTSLSKLSSLKSNSKGKNNNNDKDFECEINKEDDSDESNDVKEVVEKKDLKSKIVNNKAKKNLN